MGAESPQSRAMTSIDPGTVTESRRIVVEGTLRPAEAREILQVGPSSLGTGRGLKVSKNLPQMATVTLRYAEQVVVASNS